MTRLTRIAIVDDQPIFRIGLRSLLGISDDIAIVAEGTNAGEAEAIARVYRPDIFLFYFSANHKVSQAFIDFIASHPKIKTILMTDTDGDPCAMAALSAGAQGYLLKATPPEEFLTALRGIAEGRPYISPVLATGLLVKPIDRSPPPSASTPWSALGLLNGRDRQVLRLASQGHTNSEIALELGLATQTVKNQMSAISRKLGVRRRSGAISLYLSDRRRGDARLGGRETD